MKAWELDIDLRGGTKVMPHELSVSARGTAEDDYTADQLRQAAADHYGLPVERIPEPMFIRLDMIDFPTGFQLQRRIGWAQRDHLHSRCSAVQTNGAMLCDCGAIAVEWARLGADGWERYVPDECRDAAMEALDV
jgi:hypothetical protein